MAERQYKQRYQYGTEAPKYPYESHPTPREKTRRRISIIPKPDTDFKFLAQILLCGIITFVASGLFVHQSSILLSKQQELRRVNDDIRKVQSDINSVQAIIASQVDLEYIQQMATEQLQMAEPLAHQIVYIELSEESYTTYDE